MRRAPISQVRSEITRTGRRFRPRQIFQPWKQSPAFCLAGGAVANVDVRSEEPSNSARPGSQPLVVDSSDRTIRVERYLEFSTPLDAVGIPGLRREFNRPLAFSTTLAGFGGPQFQSCSASGLDLKQRTPHRDLHPVIGCASKNVRVSK